MTNLKYSNSQIKKSREFLASNARKLDCELYNAIFENSPSENVLRELRKFQNKDGGFAYGIEPDFQTPVSSNMATTYAFQYVERLNLAELPDFMKGAISFFENNYSEQFRRWIPIPKETNNSPHAPWWEYTLDKYISDSEWGNPTVEIIGYLLKYSSTFDKAELEKLKDMAIKRLLHSNETEVHELMCYQRFAKSLPPCDYDVVYEKIAGLARKQVERDSSKWHTYVSKPSYFVDSPDSPVYQVLGKEMNMELDYIIDTVDKDGSWSPNWEWGQYINEWNQIKPEIAGIVTVRNLLLLKNFGRIRRMKSN